MSEAKDSFGREGQPGEVGPEKRFSK